MTQREVVELTAREERWLGAIQAMGRLNELRRDLEQVLNARIGWGLGVPTDGPGLLVGGLLSLYVLECLHRWCAEPKAIMALEVGQTIWIAVGGYRIAIYRTDDGFAIEADCSGDGVKGVEK